MRILGGKLKGSKILTNNERVKDSKSFITRPTSDRVKETLFNIIEHGFNIDFSKVSFLDCFSGSGAVGLEAISRGCSIVSFLEKNSVACDCITKNLSNFNLDENDQVNNYRILKYDFFDKKLSLEKKFDVVFIDPPYELVKASKVFMRLKELRVTKINSLIIYESNRELVKTYGLEILRSRKIGQTHLNFLKVFN
tara:strand:+ start:19 stop:603 length:585 start_codon:yes stop_codon:yes gene_type:complete